MALPPPEQQSLIGILVERVTNLTTTVERVEKAVVKAVDDHEIRLRTQSEVSVAQALKTMELEGRVKVVEDQQRSNVADIKTGQSNTSHRTWALVMFGLSVGVTIIIKLVWG